MIVIHPVYIYKYGLFHKGEEHLCTLSKLSCTLYIYTSIFPYCRQAFVTVFRCSCGVTNIVHPVYIYEYGYMLKKVHVCVVVQRTSFTLYAYEYVDVQKYVDVQNKQCILYSSLCSECCAHGRYELYIRAYGTVVDTKERD